MSKKRSVAVIGSSKKRQDSYEFNAANISSASVGRDIDPIISIDHFHIRKPMFPPHPHAGFSAITYLFEDSEGEFINRDSAGNYHVAHPGAVVWNVTGSGVMHEEFPKEEGRLSHGLQMFINLASTEKMQKPHVTFIDGPDVPSYTSTGKQVRVIAGAFDRVKAKIQPPGGITFLDIKLEPGISIEKDLPTDDNVLLYIIKGSVLVGDNSIQLKISDAAGLNNDGDFVSITAESEGVHLVLIAGKPLREPVVAHGPFIMNTEDQIAAAFQRYKSGEMGTLKPVNNY